MDKKTSFVSNRRKSYKFEHNMKTELSFLQTIPLKSIWLFGLGFNSHYATFNTCGLQHCNHLLRAIHLVFNAISAPRHILAQSNSTSGKHKTHLDFILASFCAHERKMFATSDVSDSSSPNPAYAVKH